MDLRSGSITIPDIAVEQPNRIGDSRGYFVETWRASVPGREAFVQDNESLSTLRGTLRGLHFQAPPFAQAKLVRCVRGAILDVSVDLRMGSPSYGQHMAVELSGAEGRQVYIPAGFAHGFCTLEPDTLVQYKVSAPYAPAHDRGLAFDDPAVGIEWPVDMAEAIMSDRDRRHPRLAELPAYFFAGPHA